MVNIAEQGRTADWLRPWGKRDAHASSNRERPGAWKTMAGAASFLETRRDYSV